MIDTAVLKEALAGYREKFASELWHKGRYKWEAVKCFQDNWDLDAATDKYTYIDAATGEGKETSAFKEMLIRCLAGVKDLLSSGNHAYAVIMALVNIAPKEVQAMFQALYDDNGDLSARIKAFREKSRELMDKYGSKFTELDPAVSGAEQNEHALSVYLWLRFPDKYYVYTYSEARDMARLLKSGHKFTKGSSDTNLANCYELYDEIREEIRRDEELRSLFKEQLTDACYPDPELCTLTQDVGFYLSRDYKEKMTVKQELDLYDKAAARIKRYAETHTINYVTSAEEINSLLEDFQKRFAPEVLEKLSDDTLLKYIFLTGNGDKQSLCYCLEFDTKIKSIFGSIAGGSSHKYGLFKGSDGKWVTGSPKNPKELTDEEALLEGKKIRDGLVSGCGLIKERQLNTRKDYEALDDALHEIMGPLAGRAWVQKYFHLIFTDKFSPWYVTNLLIHHLLGFGIEPSSKYYGMSGQLALVRRRTGYLAPHFGDVCYAIFGRLTRFFRLNLPEEEPQVAEHWQSEGIVALGCGKTGDLSQYLNKNSLDVGKLTGVLKKEYYDSDAKAAAKRAGELKAFYDANASAPRISDVLLVTQGKRLVALVDQLDKYYFDSESETAHRKKGQWHQVFAADEVLPVDEGADASFCELKKTENLLYLYKKYYRDEGIVPPPTVDKKIEPDPAVQPHGFWWLNAKPSIWSFSDLEVGEEQSYTLYNDSGNKRRIFKNFLDAKVGDRVIGYASHPVKKIVALGCVSAEQDGKKIFFKKLEDIAFPIDIDTLRSYPELAGMEFFKNPTGSLFKLTKEEYDFILSLIKKPPIQPPDMEKYDKAAFLEDVYMSEEQYERLTSLVRNKKNVILQGAPGVGKTFAAKRLAYALMGHKDESRVELVQFHQSYSYEDFMMGYKPYEDGFELQYGVFYRFCQEAANHPDKDYFFIIDEINRGNLSRIFGELLMLIERDYRDTKVTLPYSGQVFSVPRNLYLIGMMNTADRSLAMIDYALRRRFSFYTMEPAFKSDGFRKYQEGLGSETLNKLIEKVKELNEEISKDKSLGKGFVIGHSYFCGKTECTDDAWLREIVDFDILPMLEEYWFDDQEKVKKWKDILSGVFDG